jgi:gliding motility-associated-like protein
VKAWFVVLCTWVNLVFFGQNYLYNGDFELGGPGIGFNVNGNGYTLISPPYTGTTSPGNYTVTHQPELVNTAFFLPINDHTSGYGKMLVVDGGTVGGNQPFWQAGSNGGGVCGLTPGNDYLLTYWLHSVSSTVTNVATQADIKAVFNNAANIQVLTQPTTAPLPAAGWQSYSILFTANAACINIALYDDNLSTVGNDFAIDDISVFPLDNPLFASASTTRPNCSDSLSGGVFVETKGGIPPYSFQLNGPSGLLSNNQGAFLGLESGTYSCTVTDANNQTFTLLNVLLYPNNYLEVSPSDTSICSNASVIISVTSDQNPSYLWSASPSDPGLINTNNDSINVSPNQTTVYTVSTNDLNFNLLTNGNFEAGNTGFYTDLTFLTPSNPTGIQTSYGLSPNANFWEPTFAACVDHTLGNGVGIMMVVDGAISGNSIVWRQNVVVEPQKNYTFQYHGQSVDPVNPAVLQVRINGLPISTDTLSNVTCSWQAYSVTWNSGSDTVATIEMVNLNQTGIGNDFALDDLSFFTLKSCTQQSTVHVNIGNADLGLTYPNELCAGFPSTSPQLTPGIPTNGIYTAQPQGLNIDPLSGVLSSNGTLPGTYEIIYSTNLCGAVAKDTFLLEVHALPVLLSLTGGAYDCPSQSFDSVLLYLNAQFPVNVIYSLNGMVDTLQGTSNPMYLGSNAGLYTLLNVVDLECANPLNGSLLLDSLLVPQPPMVVGESTMCENEPSSVLSLSNMNPNGVVSWYSDSLLTQYLESGNAFYPSNNSSATYYVVQSVAGCVSPLASFTVNLVPCNLVIPSAFTPDDDGDNDVWEIVGLDAKFPLNQVRVFNRWGELIYNSLEGNYASSPWNGTHQGKVLPNGSYFYIIEKAVDGSIEPINGTVSILRKP